MHTYDYQELYKNYTCLIDRLMDLNQLQKQHQEQIHRIESETNAQLDNYQENFNEASSEEIQAFARYLDSAYGYADELVRKIQSLRLYLDSRVPNLSSVWHIAEEKASSQIPAYLPEPLDNAKVLEQLLARISPAVQSYVDSQAHSFLGRGLKLLGLQDDSALMDTCVMIKCGELFFTGLNSYFESLYNTHIDAQGADYETWRDNLFQKADRQVQEADTQLDQLSIKWQKDFLSFLAQQLPPEGLRTLSQRYDEEKEKLTRQNTGPVSTFLPIGRLYCYIGSIKSFPEVYEALIINYKDFIRNDYICASSLWNPQIGNHLLLTQKAKTDMGIKVMESLLFQYLRAFPAGDVQFQVCSANGILENFFQLPLFISRFPKIAGEKIHTETDEIRAVLKKHTEIMDDILQKKLIGYTGIQEFNRKNPNIRIPFRILAITGFPGNFSSDMAEHLLRLIRQGSQAGISVFLNSEQLNTDRECHSDNLFKEILNFPETYEIKEYYLRNMQYPCIDFIPDTETQNSENIIDEFSVNYQRASKKVLDLASLIPQENLFRSVSTEWIRIPIGMNENGQIHYLEMGDPVANGTSHYGLIIGATGSGKSTLLHTIITNAILSYEPDELQLYLMDFKEGTEFKIYEDKKIPNIRCLALDTMQEFGESILTELWNLLKQRNELFTEASKNGAEIKNIRDYRRAGYTMPRILVVIDEFQVLFDREHNKKVADKCASLMSEFISKARAYGIHFLFATQTLHKIYEGGSAISKSTLEEMHIRIGLQCQEKELELLFGSGNLKECLRRQSGKKGSAVYLENDIVSRPIGVQIAYAAPEEQNRLLKQAEEHYAHVDYQSPLIFRGKSQPTLPHDRPTGCDTSLIYLGEPVRIAPPIRLSLTKKRRTNLLAAGENQHLLDRIASLWLYQALQYKKAEPNTGIYLFDGGEMIEEPGLLSQLKVTAQKEEAFTLVDNVFRVLPVIEKIYRIYETRKQRMITGDSRPEDKAKVHVLISNYQWIEPLIRIMENKNLSEFESAPAPQAASNSLDDMLAKLKSDSFNSNTQLNCSQKFRTLLESGYMCGIHVFMSCNDFAYIKKLLSSDLAPFTNRIILKTGSSAVYNFIDTDINLNLISDNTAVFSDSVKPAYLFKPYKL